MYILLNILLNFVEPSYLQCDFCYYSTSTKLHGASSYEVAGFTQSDVHTALFYECKCSCIA